MGAGERGLRQIAVTRVAYAGGADAGYWRTFVGAVVGDEAVGVGLPLGTAEDAEVGQEGDGFGHRDQA